MDGVRLSLSVVEAALAASTTQRLRARASRLTITVENVGYDSTSGSGGMVSDRVVLLYLMPPPAPDGSQPRRQLATFTRALAIAPGDSQL